MKTTVKVADLKCGSCANSIHRSLAMLTGVFGVRVDNETREITVDHTDEIDRDKIVAKLLAMGYTEQGRVL